MKKTSEFVVVIDNFLISHLERTKNFVGEVTNRDVHILSLPNATRNLWYIMIFRKESKVFGGILLIGRRPNWNNTQHWVQKANELESARDNQNIHNKLTHN